MNDCFGQAKNIPTGEPKGVVGGMSGVIWGGIAPHPPIIVPAIGRGDLAQAESTRAALTALSEDVQAANPDAIIIISPHSPLFQDAVAIWNLPEMTGSFADFGAGDLAYSIRNDLRLVEAIASEAERLGVSVLRLDERLARRYHLQPRLDHGLLVPLSYLRAAGVTASVVPVAMGFMSLPELYRFGKAVQRAAGLLEKKVAVLASSDLSHRLTSDAPAGYSPAGPVFDATLADHLARADVPAILAMDPALREEAGECGYRPIVMLLGALDGREVAAEVLSYEGPFGVGYLVGRLIPGAINHGREYLARLDESKAGAARPNREDESAPVRLARRSLESYILDRLTIEPPASLPPELSSRAGVFVSLKKDGQLRGCIGTFLPTQASIAAEIIHNAISAGTEDPRFYPVHASELDELVYSVDVLSEPEPVSDLASLDPLRYGVIVRCGRRTGLLLPNLDGVGTVEEQLAIARQKAGIKPGETASIQRFGVVRYQ